MPIGNVAFSFLFYVVVWPTQRPHSIKIMTKRSADYFTGEDFDGIFEVLENDEKEMAKEMSQAMNSVVNESRFWWKLFSCNSYLRDL